MSRRFTLAGIAVAAPLLAVVVGSLVWLHTLQPLKTGSGFSGVEGSSVYRAGATVTLETPIENASPLRVHLLGLQPSRPGELGMLQPFAAGLKTDGRATVPLGVASLAPHQSGELIVRARYADCEWFSVNSAETYEQFPVRWHVTGLTRTSWVELAQPFVVKAPAACPARPEDAATLTPDAGPYPLRRTRALSQQAPVTEGRVQLAVKRRSPTAFDVDVRLDATVDDGYDVSVYLTAQHVLPGLTEGGSGDMTKDVILPKGRSTHHFRTVVTGVHADCVVMYVMHSDDGNTDDYASARICDRR